MSGILRARSRRRPAALRWLARRGDLLLAAAGVAASPGALLLVTGGMAIEEGQLVDAGCHDELLEQCPLYQRSWELQAGSEAKTEGRGPKGGTPTSA